MSLDYYVGYTLTDAVRHFVDHFSDQYLTDVVNCARVISKYTFDLRSPQRKKSYGFKVR